MVPAKADKIEKFQKILRYQKILSIVYHKVLEKLTEFLQKYIFNSISIDNKYQFPPKPFQAGDPGFPRKGLFLPFRSEYLYRQMSKFVMLITKNQEKCSFFVLF